MKEKSYPVRMTVLGCKAALRRVRTAKTRQRKFLGQVGTKWRLIDEDWLSSQFRAVIQGLAVEEARLLRDIEQLKSDGREGIRS